MADYDAIVIGAGHNGLTAGVVMAGGGMRVLVVEKNQYVGGMAATTELIRGYRFEIAGSVLFPVPDEIHDALDLGACPTLESELMSVNVGEPGTTPMLFHADPERLVEHLLEVNGLDAVTGMAEVAAWCEAPARAIGRADVRRGPRSLDEMFACANDEREREAIRTALFGSVMDVVDRYLPDRERHAVLRGMLAFLSVNSTYRGPYTPGSAMCLAFALTAPGTQMIRKVRGGLGAMCAHLRERFEDRGGEVRLHAKVEEIVTDGGRVTGVRLVDGDVISAPVVVSNLDPTMTFTKLLDPAVVPEPLRERASAIDHRAAYVQVHFALAGLPEFVDEYAVANEGVRRANLGVFGSPEQMQRDFEGCTRGEVPASPSFGFQVPSLLDPSLAPEGKHAASAYAFYFPITGTREEQNRLADVMADRVVERVARMAPDFPGLIERRVVYPSYAYELMFGATGGDFCHGLLQPELMGPFRPGPTGWADRPVPVDGLLLSGSGCHGGPGVTFIPGYNAGHAALERL